MILNHQNLPANHQILQVALQAAEQQLYLFSWFRPVYFRYDRSMYKLEQSDNELLDYRAEARVFSKRLSIGWTDFLYWPCFLSSRFADCSLPLPSPSSASIRRQYLVSRGRSIVYPRQSLSSFCSRMLNDIAVNLWTRCDQSTNSDNDTKTVSINHIAPVWQTGRGGSSSLTSRRLTMNPLNEN